MTSQEALDLVLEANRGTLWPQPDGITLQEFIDHTIGRSRVFMPGTRTRISTFHAMSRDYELIDPPRRTYFEISEIFRPADRIAFRGRMFEAIVKQDHGDGGPICHDTTS